MRDGVQRAFESLNFGSNHTFKANELSIGLVVPIEHYPDQPVPSMERHIERAKLAESLDFKAL